MKKKKDTRKKNTRNRPIMPDKTESIHENDYRAEKKKTETNRE